jgi:hypothetical protein
MKRQTTPKNSSNTPDVAADNPDGTLDRFAAGLSKVLSTSKADLAKRQRRRALQKMRSRVRP